MMNRSYYFDLTYVASALPSPEKLQVLHDLSLQQMEGNSELLLGYHFLVPMAAETYPVSIAARLVPLDYFLQHSQVFSPVRLFFQGEYSLESLAELLDDDVLPLVASGDPDDVLAGILEPVSFSTVEDICRKARAAVLDQDFRRATCRDLKDALLRYSPDFRPIHSLDSENLQELPLISFLVAAHNEQRYIRQCVDSCLSQTYLNVQVCIVDDGSTDSTPQILLEQYGGDPRVKVRRMLQNRGKVRAFNAAYTMADGSYYALMGADDLAYKDRIENSYRHLVRHGLDLVVGGLLYCDAALRPMSKKPPVRKREDFVLETFFQLNPTWGGTMFFNRRVAEAAFPIPEVLLFEDWWIGFNAALNHMKIAYLPVNLIYYRMHDTNDCANVDPNNRLRARIRDVSRHFTYYDAFNQRIAERPDISSLDKLRYFSLIEEQVASKRKFLEENGHLCPPPTP